MDKRSTEGHMDYEWQNNSGPVDSSSPFLKHAANYQQQQANNAAKKRPFSVLSSSPGKANTFPSLRPPTSQSTFLFSQPSANSPAKPLPPTPISTNPAFMTPRTKYETNYDSSEVELTSSPDYNPDSDATPDKMGLRAGLSKTSSTLSQILAPDKAKKNNPVTGRLAALSGKGELQRSAYHTGVEKRVRKTRSRTGSKWLMRRKGSSGSESDDEEAKRQAEAQKAARPGAIASLFGFIEMHPDIPHILSFYAQLLLNVFLVLFFIYIVYCFWATIRSDVDKKSEEAIADILAEMAVCAQNFQQNGCGSEKRAPALETVCNNWERCMNKDPRAVGRARVSAHTFAEIFNSFIEPISYKAMIFSFVLIFGCVGISNFAFGFFRNKAHPPPPPPMPSQYMQTPQRHPSGQQEFYWNAYQSPMARNPEASATAGVLDMHSPVRRLQY